MSNTEASLQTFKKFLPIQLVKRGYDYDDVSKLISLSKKQIANNKPVDSCLILDDCMYDSKIMKSQDQKELHLNGRHYHITLFNTTQYLMVVPPVIRSNIDYVICLQDSVLSNRKKLYQFFFGAFATFKEFDTVFRQITENNRALVLDNTKKTNIIEDAIFHYKASLNIPRFRIGRDMFFNRREKRKHKNDKSIMIVQT